MDSHGEADRSKARHGGLKGSKPRGRLRKMGWEGGMGRRCRRSLRGLRNRWGLQEQFKGPWDGKCTELIYRYIQGRREFKGVSTWKTNTLTEAMSPLKGERLP